MEMAELDANQLQEIYQWVDSVPLSRPKKNIARDFSDGVLLAEVVFGMFPKLVELHNYSSTNARDQKLTNWATLNQKVFRKMGFQLDKAMITDCVDAKKGAIELTLAFLQTQLKAYKLRLEDEVLLSNNGNVDDIIYSSYGAQNAQPQRDAAAAPIGAKVAPIQSRTSPPAMASVAKVGPVSSGVKKTAVAPRGKVSPPAAAQRQAQAQAAQQQQQQPVPVQERAHVSAADYERLLSEKDSIITDLSDTVEILQVKVQKLEQLLQIKNAKIDALAAKLG